ncbi:endonuclease [Acinetobacter phage vB_AbaM_ME3]|uniref:Bacteriophage T5 Orf172 DNA-binding domain-containing protein n=1 Tax=Acinetobacter phage vB_AbaM_ME3 TaxID=1837876 RepID=A0A172Q109_9CAUD|nr:endonuclease [Acinetobacter phage vB_AbaM_ME3]AND75469.1 hypothetical protein ME3_308 [Acinetobacter phage vB_AbaM_ME3]
MQYGGNRFDYSLIDYNKNNVKIKIICNQCSNTFEQTPANHLHFNGCKPCETNAKSKRNTKSKDKVIEDFVKMHGTKYDYSKVDYKAWNIKITIGCPHHGDFKQEPNSHLQGNGCPKCGRLKLSRFGGMTNLDESGLEPARIYLVKFKSKQYEFIKVGVTSRTVEDRFKPVVYKQFEKEVILDLEAKARDVVNIEKLVLSTFDSDRYYISDGNAFKGCTELFKFKALNEIKSFIEEKIKSSSDE